MIAILGGLGAAIAFSVSMLASSRSSRLIGADSVVAWVMVVGLAVALPAALWDGVPAQHGAATIGWLAVAGCGNVGGLLLGYSALRVGRVGIVAPITSTEGAIAALIAVGAGEHLAPLSGVMLAVIACGVALAGAARDAVVPRETRAILLAVAAAIAFGAGLYATGRISARMPIPWAVLPARLVGVLVVAVPLALTSRLRLTRRALPLVVASGVAEVAGFASFAVGARHGIAVSAVLASQFAAISAVAAYLLFHERLVRLQIAGVVLVLVGVAVLSAAQA